MSTTPFYKVFMGGKNKKDITEYVSSVSYEDSMEEDSQVEINIHKDKVMELLNDDRINEGTVINFQFGYYSGVISKVHTAFMKDIDVNYSQNGVTLTIRALDKGNDMKKSSSAKVWQGKTTSEIAYEIAKYYKLKTAITKTTTPWPDEAQGNKSDMDFLRYLASREEDGDFVAYIRNNTLYLKHRDLKQKSIKTFTWGAGDPGEVISFAPKWRESTKKAEAGTTIANGAVANNAMPNNYILGMLYNKVTGNLINAGGHITSKGTYEQQPNPNVTTNGIWNGRPQFGPSDPGKFVLTPGPNTYPPALKTAKNLAASSKKKADLKVLTATLRVLLSPRIEPNAVLTMAGCADRHNGNWFIEKVKHSISGSIADTTIYLVRNGKKGAKGEKAKLTNTATGPKKQDSKVIVRSKVTGDFPDYFKNMQINPLGSSGSERVNNKNPLYFPKPK